MRMLSIVLSLAIIFHAVPANGWKASAAASTAHSVTLKDFSGAASGLFGNTRVPAALISGSCVGMGILSAPKIEDGDSKKMKLIKKANLLLAIGSLLSEILAVTYSTVAINKLSELEYEPTASVSDLISEHHELAWIGTNIHFLFGLFGFGLLSISKAYFLYGKSVGDIVACWGSAAMLFCMSIVNRGIAQGVGKAHETTNAYATNLFMLTLRYLRLVLDYSRGGVTPVVAIGLLLLSFVPLTKMFAAEEEKAKKE